LSIAHIDAIRCTLYAIRNMAKIKFTKGELKRQRDALAQFRHYLPTLQLKKQQLQMKISEARCAIVKIERERDEVVGRIEKWSGLLAEAEIELKEWVAPAEAKTTEVNIAGANVPIFESIFFKEQDYDLYETPFWIDKAIAQLQQMVRLNVQGDVLQEQIRILARELRVTTQRVNLFEKVKIPECQDNIRRIRIYLGDQQANAVGIGKVAKGKIEKREEEEMVFA